MSRRAAGWLAWGLLAVFGVSIGAGLVLQYARDEPPGAFVTYLSLAVAFGLFAVMGLLIVTRRPDNVMGWLYCAIGLGTAYTFVSPSYRLYTLERPGRDFPLVAITSLLESVVWSLNLTLIIVFALLLFPTGRPLSRRWSIVGWIAGIGLTLSTLATVLTGGQILGIGETVDNPIGIEAFRPVGMLLYDVADILMLVSCPLAVAAIIVRFHRARGVERQQIKWLAFAATGGFVLAAGNALLQSPLGDVGFAIAIAMIPLMTGLAILRYRLFDIDRLNNRALVYSLLSGVLALVYLAAIAVFDVTLRGMSGQSSDLATAASTLLVAGLFRPVRGRIQSTVDQRFYRRAYDAARVLEQFG
ncbi:MAG TPA: hypothetical protein VFV93_04575, partial [Thermomicrobiales bacterium]|nr:hypothetical protein [Thermomicrobiales bacterium]